MCHASSQKYIATTKQSSVILRLLTLTLIHVDLIKLLLCEGYHSCLTIIDLYTRCPQAVPIPDTAGSTAAQSIIGPLFLVRLYISPLIKVANLKPINHFVGAKHQHGTLPPPG